MSEAGFVAVLVIDLHFPESGSLKSKRKELSSIKAQLHGRLGVAVSEADHQDLWQRAKLTAALTGGSLATLSVAADRVQRWLERAAPTAWTCSGRSPWSPTSMTGSQLFGGEG